MRAAGAAGPLVVRVRAPLAWRHAGVGRPRGGPVPALLLPALLLLSGMPAFPSLPDPAFPDDAFMDTGFVDPAFVDPAFRSEEHTS